MVRINKKRFALSLAIVGAIGVPVSTKSFKSAHLGRWATVYEDDADRYLKTIGLGEYYCIVAARKDDMEREICQRAYHLRGQNVIERREAIPNSLGRMIVYALIGFLTPWIIIFGIPPIVKLYARWMTEESKTN